MPSMMTSKEPFTSTFSDLKVILKKNSLNHLKHWIRLLHQAELNHPDDICKERLENFNRLVMDDITSPGGLTASSTLERQIEELKRLLKASGASDNQRKLLIDSLQTEIRKLRLPVRHTEPYEIEEMISMLKALDNWIEDPSNSPSMSGQSNGKRKRASGVGQYLRLRCMIAICISLGPRTSALRSLKIDDIDLESNILKFAETKGRMFVEVQHAHLPSFAVKRIEPWIVWLKENRPHETHVCSGLRKNSIGPVDETNLTRPMRQLCQHLGILSDEPSLVKDRCGFHRFRSSIAVEAFEKNIAPHIVGQALSHDDDGTLAMTVYGRRARDRLADEGRKPLQELMSALLNGPDSSTRALDALSQYLDSLESLGAHWSTFSEFEQRTNETVRANYISELVLNMNSTFLTDTHAIEAGFTVDMGDNVAPTAGLEPATCGLTVRRSTN